MRGSGVGAGAISGEGVSPVAELAPVTGVPVNEPPVLEAPFSTAPDGESSLIDPDRESDWPFDSRLLCEFVTVTLPPPAQVPVPVPVLPAVPLPVSKPGVGVGLCPAGVCSSPVDT